MSRLTSVHVNIPLPLPEPGDGSQKTSLCDAAATASSSFSRRRRRANTPRSWQKLTQAQMYLTNSRLPSTQPPPLLLCMSKCEPDGSEQRRLGEVPHCVRRLQTRGTLELIRARGAERPQIPPSLTVIQWFHSFQHRRACPRTPEPSILRRLGSAPLPLPTVSQTCDSPPPHLPPLQLEHRPLVKHCSRVFLRFGIFLCEDDRSRSRVV